MSNRPAQCSVQPKGTRGTTRRSAGHGTPGEDASRASNRHVIGSVKHKDLLYKDMHATVPPILMAQNGSVHYMISNRRQSLFNLHTR